MGQRNHRHTHTHQQHTRTYPLQLIVVLQEKLQILVRYVHLCNGHRVSRCGDNGKEKDCTLGCNIPHLQVRTQLCLQLLGDLTPTESPKDLSVPERTHVHSARTHHLKAHAHTIHGNSSSLLSSGLEPGCLTPGCRMSCHWRTSSSCFPEGGAKANGCKS